MRHAYKILIGKSEGKRPVGRYTRTWENNIKMNLRETALEDVDWIRLAKDSD
jgi:hypothetical protein